jgi:2-polyprenyl-3-methyl-5-hydroxy-6-metoxy-1,4-benzoquinol methylase
MEAKPDSYYALARSPLLARLRRPVGRVLDLGCGDGGNADELRAAGATRLVGVEVMPGPAARAKHRFDEVRFGDALTELHELDEQFDTLLAYDVLEHLADPKAVLDRMHELAAPGAILHISTPNARHWSLARDVIFKGTFGYTEWGHRDTTHLRWFTRRDLDALLDTTGWAPTSWRASSEDWLEIKQVPGRRFFPRLGNELGAVQWSVLADAT